MNRSPKIMKTYDVIKTEHVVTLDQVIGREGVSEVFLR